MDEERRKRKIMEETAGAAKEAEEENEEEKIEEFFALIRSTKELKQRLARSGQVGVSMKPMEKEKSGERKAKSNEEKPANISSSAAVWNPTFQPQDFMNVYGHCSIANSANQTAAAGNSRRQVEEEGKERESTKPEATAGFQEASGLDTKRDDKGDEGNDGLNLKLSL